MTSRPEPRGRATATSLSTSSPSRFAFPAIPSRPRQPDSSTIPSKSAAVDGPHNRPGLVSRASASSTKASRPRHLHAHSKSSSLIPTLSTLTHWQPTMASSNAGTSSGAADLLRQAMMQR